LFDFAPIGYATLAADGLVREINHVGASILDEVRGHVVGRRFALFITPSERTAFSSMLEDVRANDVKRTRIFEVLRTNAEGPSVRFVAHTLAHRDVTVLLAFDDVTAQKRAEARLKQVDEELREADRRKDEFLAVLSHELRTPLSALLLHGQLLKQGGMDDGEVQRTGTVIERAARAQARLVEDLLDVSRIVSGKLSLKRDEVKLPNTVQAAVDAVAEEARKRKISLVVSVDPTVSSLIGDPTRLQQAVWNLLTNAIKFTPEKGRIWVTLEQLNDHARIEVRDSGAGIDREFLPYLFVRFSQADRTTTRSAGGLGLGLSIAHSIIEAHRGTIQAASKGRGTGSTFTILLPIRDTAFKSTGVNAALRSTSVTNIRGAKLLVVEDDAGTRATLTKVLEHAGAKVRDAESGDAAMKVLGRFKPDLLLCDIAMPTEDGYSLLRRIRALGEGHGGDVPALALTAFASEEERVRTREAGFLEHVVKPVDIDRLLELVSGLLPPNEPKGNGSIEAARS
jgi:signal transduction histidine kinase/ActR/RegA family two-component response regulator